MITGGESPRWSRGFSALLLGALVVVAFAAMILAVASRSPLPMYLVFARLFAIGACIALPVVGLLQLPFLRYLERRGTPLSMQVVIQSAAGTALGVAGGIILGLVDRGSSGNAYVPVGALMFGFAGFVCTASAALLYRPLLKSRIVRMTGLTSLAVLWAIGVVTLIVDV